MAFSSVFPNRSEIRGNPESTKIFKWKTKKSNKKERRSWNDLPDELLFSIFSLLGPALLLQSIQFVCSSWRDVSKDSSFFRYLDLENHWRSFKGEAIHKRKLVRQAVDQSNGQLVKISLGEFATNDLLYYIVDRSRNTLISLKLEASSITSLGLQFGICELPNLEEVELNGFPFKPDLIAAIGRWCPKLKSFRYQGRYKCPKPIVLCGISEETDEDEILFAHVLDNAEAFAIAQSMPGLRRLSLLGNFIHDIGLSVILEKCPFLEYVDLRCCSNIELDPEILMDYFNRVKVWRLPHECIIDYEYDQKKVVYGPSYTESDSDSDFDSEDMEDESFEGCYMSDIDRMALHYLEKLDKKIARSEKRY